VYQQVLADFCLQKDAAQHYCLKAEYLAEWSGAQMLRKKVCNWLQVKQSKYLLRVFAAPPTQKLHSTKCCVKIIGQVFRAPS